MPTPTLPELSTDSSVLVEVPPVVEAIAKSVVGAPEPLVEVARMESCAYGVVVPTPKLPLTASEPALPPPTK